MNNRGVFKLRDMIGSKNVQAQMPDGRWARAVPEPFAYGLMARLMAAWEVVLGRAHAVEWPTTGEFEAASRDPLQRT